MADLTLSQQRILSVLAFLNLRMRRNESAARYYRALLKLCDSRSSEYRRALSGLAAASIGMRDADAALLALRNVNPSTLSSRESAVELLRAQALWQQGRHEEARSACDEYIYLSGSGSSGRNTK